MVKHGKNTLSISVFIVIGKSSADVSLVVLWAIIFYTVLKIITRRALRDKCE